MATTNYPYTISTAFPNAKVNVEVLQATIQQSAIATALEYINANVIPDECDIYFVDPLSAPDVAILDAIVAAHQGVGYVSTMLGSTPILDVTVVEDLTWQVVGGVVTTPTFFTQVLTEIIGRLVGQHKGDGGQIRVVEEVTGQADAEMVVPPFDFPDTLGVWQSYGVSTNVPPRAGYQNTYRVEARLNGATNLALRFSTISMIKTVTY